MQKSENTRAQRILKYYPAQIHENKETYISYYVENPLSGELVRKKIKLNRIKNKITRRTYARHLVAEINKKLSEGWNPYLQDNNVEFKTLSEALQLFVRFKTKELRSESMRAYNSLTNIFSEFIKNIDQKKQLSVLSIDESIAIKYMDYIYFDRDVEERRYNNVLSFQVSLFNWFIEHNYAVNNPFISLKFKKEKEKKRKLIPEDVRLQIKDYLIQNNPRFLAAIMIQFHALLRPKELLQTQIKNINLDKNIIYVPASVAKNGNERFATIPDVLVPYIEMLNIERYNPEWYVFSNKLFPGEEIKLTKYLGRRWSSMRKVLNLPNKYQMYSLRDSGIVKMLSDGISIHEVARQADHHSLEITSRYALHSSTEASKNIKTKNTNF